MAMIVYAYIDLKYPLSIYISLFPLVILIIPVLSCYYFLRKKIVVSVAEQMLIYSPAFRKKIKIAFADIENIKENQHGLSLFRKGVSKKVFSIGFEYIGYEMFKDELKKHDHIVFEYQEVGIGKSF